MNLMCAYKMGPCNMIAPPRTKYCARPCKGQMEVATFLVWPCIPAIRYAILIAKSIFLLLMNTAAAAAAHSGTIRQKRAKSEKNILRFQKILTIINSWLLMLVMVLCEKKMHSESKCIFSDQKILKKTFEN